MSATTRREFLRAGAGAGVLLTASGVGSASGQATRTSVRVGVVLPLSGPYADQGSGGARGIQFCAEQLNARGGLLGRRIEVIVEDTQLKPQVAVVKATKLINQDQVHFLMGEISGASTLALLEVAERSKVVMLTPYSSPEAVTGTRGTRYQFRTYSNTWIQASIAADYVTRHLGKRWGVMAADYAYGQDYARHLKKFVTQRGGQVVAEVFPPLGTTDFASFLAKAAAGDPDVLWMVEYGRDAAVALNQATAMGLKKKMALGLGVANTEQVKGMQPGAFEGTYALVIWYPNWPGEATKAFVKAYHARHGDYSEAAGVHYTGAQVLFQAVASAGSVDADAVIKALEDREFETIKGRIRMRGYDHQAVQAYFMGRGVVVRDWPIPVYEPVKWYEAETVERDFMPPADPRIHPVRWRQS